MCDATCKSLGEQLQSTYVCRRPSSVSNHVFDFSSETTDQILMKLGHNDNLVLGIRIHVYTFKGSDLPGGPERLNLLAASPLKPLIRFWRNLVTMITYKGSMPNSAYSFNNLYNENIGHILMKLDHNDHLAVVGIRFYT